MIITGDSAFRTRWWSTNPSVLLFRVKDLLANPRTDAPRVVFSCRPGLRTLEPLANLTACWAEDRTHKLGKEMLKKVRSYYRSRTRMEEVTSFCRWAKHDNAWNRFDNTGRSLRKLGQLVVLEHRTYICSSLPKRVSVVYCIRTWDFLKVLSV